MTRVHHYRLLVCHGHDTAALNSLEPVDWFPKTLADCGGTVERHYPQGRHGVNAVVVSFRGPANREIFTQAATQTGAFLCVSFGPRAK